MSGKDKNKEKRARLMNALVHIRSPIKIDLKLLFMTLLGSEEKKAKNEAEWLRLDLNNRLWDDSYEEYAHLTDLDKYRLATLCDVGFPGWIDHEKWKPRLLAEFYGIEDSPLSTNPDSPRILHQVAMAQSVPPGDIQTQPNAEIVFNGPYDDKQSSKVTVINTSARRIGYGIKTTNIKRLGVDPPCGVLDPMEAVFLVVTLSSFTFGKEDTTDDRITFEWTNIPDGAAKQFRPEWFQGDGMVRRKNLRVEYKNVSTTPEDSTQQEKSNSSSPNTGLTSKIRHIVIRNEEEQEKKETEENNKDKSKVMTLKELLNHMVPWYRAILTPEDCSSIDMLIKQKMRRAEAKQLSENQLKYAIHSITWTITETLEESFETKESVNFTAKILIFQTRELINRLGLNEAVESLGCFRLSNDVENSTKMYTGEKIVTAIEDLLKKV